MFETVVPEAVAPRSRRLFYETLPLSLAAHAVAAAAILVAQTWTVQFPSQSPKLYAAYSLIADPPPPPPPPPPPLARPVATPTPRPAAEKMPFVAPNVIPDTIPVVETVEYEDVPAPATGPAGDAGGAEGGVEGGEIGGVVGGVIGGLPAAPEPEVIEIKRDDPLPMGAISQEFPQYPEYARSRGWQDELVVRYVIGKDGRVKEVTVIRQPERKEFARETVSTIRHWRFHPYRDERGNPKEVVHELTVQFRIARKGKLQPT